MESERSAPRGKTPKIVLRVSDPQKFREGYLLDLAAGGVFVKSEKLLQSGAVVDVELHPPGWDAPLPLHGRVVRRVEPGGPNPAGMLVGFEELAPESQLRLAELIAAFSGGGAGAVREGTPGPAKALAPTTPGRRGR